MRNLAIALLLAAAGAQAAEQDALAISANIQARHLPYGTILDPVLSGSGVVSYSRCGDSAIWTGHYLAAEAFRFAVTKSPDAFQNATVAINGIWSLLNVTGTGLLARCALPVDSPYVFDISHEEEHNGVYAGRDRIWIGNTSRDQYAGVFFALAVAYDLIPDPQVRAWIADLVTRLTEFLLDHGWNVVMPDGRISTTFLIRPDEQLTVLQIARHVNPGRFETDYKVHRALLFLTVPIPIATEVIEDHDSYSKFNVDAIDLYNLIRLEGGGLAKVWYNQAYKLLRDATGGHGNAHFNMIDRALKGPDQGRDAETRVLLDQWLWRPRVDVWVDWRGIVPACGEDSCKPLSVPERIPTDFLWQRNPFQLYGGGLGNIESSGIDYILPYWMARYYGVL